MGDTAPHGMDEFYDADIGVPDEGTMSLSNFYSKRGTQEFTINENQTSTLNLYDFAVANGWDGVKNVKFNLANNIGITGTNSNPTALEIGGSTSQGWPDGCRVQVFSYADIVGNGGEGGAGGTITPSFDAYGVYTGEESSTGQNGGNGGDAIVLQPSNDNITFHFELVNLGMISGGGGGGGGGGSGRSRVIYSSAQFSSSQPLTRFHVAGSTSSPGSGDLRWQGTNILDWYDGGGGSWSNMPPPQFPDTTLKLAAYAHGHGASGFPGGFPGGPATDYWGSVSQNAYNTYGQSVWALDSLMTDQTDTSFIPHFGTYWTSRWQQYSIKKGEVELGNIGGVGGKGSHLDMNTLSLTSGSGGPGDSTNGGESVSGAGGNGGNTAGNGFSGSSGYAAGGSGGSAGLWIRINPILITTGSATLIDDFMSFGNSDSPDFP